MSRQRNDFKTMKRRLEALRAAEAQGERNEGKTRVKDFPTVGDYLREKRAAARQATLDALVPDRRCPVCGTLKLSSRQWVIVKAGQVIGNSSDPRVQRVVSICRTQRQCAVCRSCAMTGSLAM